MAGDVSQYVLVIGVPFYGDGRAIPCTNYCPKLLIFPIMTIKRSTVLSEGY